MNVYWTGIGNLIGKYGTDYWRLSDPVKIYYDADGQPRPGDDVIISQGEVWPQEDSRARR